MIEEQQTLSIQQSIDLAVQHHTQGHLPEAESIYQQILQADPSQPVVLHLLGVIAHQIGKNGQAIELITKALAIRPDYAEAHSNLGLAQQELGRLDEAITHYRKAIDIKPDYAEAHYNLGVSLQDLGKLEAAVASYHRALDIKSNMPAAQSNLGGVYRDLGRLEDAATSYQKALRLKPDYAEAHNNLGNVLMSSKRLEEAEKFYRFALKLKPRFATAIDNLCMALESQGKSTEALEYCRKALELDPNNINARVSLAKSFDSLVPVWHTAMMNDKLRNDAYLAALQTAITADTHVLEIGTGSGLLAMMAARCGAKQVTTCEMSPLIATTAKEIISTNGMTDSIDVIAKKSTNLEMGVDLPRPADLLVFEIFSSEFLGEGVLSSIEDAKRRLLGSDGRIIPSGGTIMIALFGG
ncbi:MAG: tetratricopeptide repeat protein, partial [Gammaproteobacteria bacterium]